MIFKGKHRQLLVYLINDSVSRPGGQKEFDETIKRFRDVWCEMVHTHTHKMARGWYSHVSKSPISLQHGLDSGDIAIVFAVS